jgi:hypothetical protein
MRPSWLLSLKPPTVHNDAAAEAAVEVAAGLLLVGLERDVDDDDGDLLFSGHAYVDSDKTSTQAHTTFILLAIPQRNIQTQIHTTTT